MSETRYPNESAAYRSARDKLLEEERKLVEQTKAVAALRRELPPGGELKTNGVPVPRPWMPAREGTMDSNRLLVITSAAAVMVLAMPAAAQQATAEMHAVSAEGIGEEVGTIQLADSAEGLVIQTDLSGLPPGPHGFHLHSEGSCEPAQNDQGQMAAAMAAKGHYDPDNTKKHAGPEGDGHKGDLPVLEVATDGTAQVTLTAPRLKVADAEGRALMIHAGGDNYSDQPKPLGGGGARIACGVVQ